jgi:hypothetical protein
MGSEPLAAMVDDRDHKELRQLIDTVTHTQLLL